MTPSIRFYYDIVSPFSYFAYRILTQLRQRVVEWRAIDLEMIPIFLGGVMKVDIQNSSVLNVHYLCM